MSDSGTRYFFNVLSKTATVEDPEGTVLDSIEEARNAAIADARGLMSAAILMGRDVSARWIEICDVGGKVLLVVAFSEAISVKE